MLTQTSNHRAIQTAALIAAVGLGLVAGLPSPAHAQDREARSGPGGAGSSEFAARRLFMTGVELLEAGQDDRAVKTLERVLEQHGDLDIRYEALLALGKHYIDQRDQRRAVHYLNQVRELGQREPAPRGDLLQVYLEGLYQIGVANFQMQQYAAAFPVLRKITEEHPNTVWANQAYYYIGLCHFAQSRWQKAIEALNLVGTFVDPDSEAVQYVEAGRRFYVKVEDMDLPVVNNLGKTVQVRIEAASGDAVVTDLQPLALDEGVFIASVQTEIGPPVEEQTTPVLQVVSGDELTTYYIDGNTPEGKKDVPRKSTVKIVSTAKARFTLGTYEEPASVAYLGQPLFVKVEDADMDVSPKRDAVTVRLETIYKAEDEPTDNESFDAEDAALQEEQDEWAVRDEIELNVEELGEEPVRTGEFGGEVEIAVASDQPDRSDDVLMAERGDRVRVTFVDERHIEGVTPRDAVSTIEVVGEIDARPSATQNVVTDPVLKAKKNVVEATAFLELARIFKSMGLLDGAAEKASEGLERVDEIVTSSASIPDEERQQAFKLRWELFLVQGKYGQAIATCKLFNRLYPDSPFVDEALLGIAEVKLEQEDYDGAKSIYSEILKLENSQVKPEAQFMLAETIQNQAQARADAEAAADGKEPEPVISENAIRAYRECARKYPDSEFAGKSLGEVIEYYVKNKDYIRADDLLSQVFQDYPDAQFLDAMLGKWVVVAIKMGNFEKAYEKCSDLLFQYPESKYAEKAKQLLPKLQKRINQ